MGLDSWPFATLRTVNDLQASRGEHRPRGSSSLSRRVGLPFFFLVLERHLLSVDERAFDGTPHRANPHRLTLLFVLPRCWACMRCVLYCTC
jgi:hypothetical protein